MMKKMRLIDADMADRTVGSDEFREQLDMMETVNAEPVVHAHWVGKPLTGCATVKCSNCGMLFLSNNGKWNYCPDCGAKMDGKVKE